MIAVFGSKGNMMRLAFIGGMAWALLAGSAYAQESYSKQYIQCSNHAYGQTSVLQKCVNKELKQQQKRLKKSYKSYYRASGAYQANIAQQCLPVDSAAFEMDKARNKAHTPSGSKALKYFLVFGCEPVF